MFGEVSIKPQNIITVEKPYAPHKSDSVNYFNGSFSFTYVSRTH